MGSVNTMLGEIQIPRLVKIRQRFDDSHLEDVAAAVRLELERKEVIERIKPGMSVAITAGSRGVANLALVIKETVAFLKAHGAEPFVFPAMGSHGGAMAEGQLSIVHEYGVTEEFIGCPVIATMETVCIGYLDDGRPIHINRFAAEADGIISLNRIKPHTAFRGKYESGVMKMMTIGLGAQLGAQVCHRQGIMHLGPNVEKFAFGILEHAKILLGIGLVENAFDQTFLVRVMTKEQIPIEEPGLLDMAKKKMARILFDKVDVMIVDFIGKNISGEGMDPNVSGRWIVPNIGGGIDAQRIGILDITEETMGNVVGLGMADVCSKRVVEKMDRDTTYPNSLTSTVTSLCKIPMYFDNHKLTIQAAIKMCAGVEPENITMIRIPHTLSLDTIWISENLLEEAKKHHDVEIIGNSEDMFFDDEGNLF